MTVLALLRHGRHPPRGYYHYTHSVTAVKPNVQWSQRPRVVYRLVSSRLTSQSLPGFLLYGFIVHQQHVKFVHDEKDSLHRWWRSYSPELGGQARGEGVGTPATGPTPAEMVRWAS